MPELFCGFDRGDEEVPVRYPVACSPQAWAAGALPHLLWNLLGLRGDALHGRLRAVRPRLPAGLDWLELSGMQVGGATLDLRFERLDGDGRARVQSRTRSGTMDVSTTEDLPTPDEFG
jgi:hypothetical protein